MRWFRIERVTAAERALWAVLVGAVVAPLALRPTPQEVVRAYVEALDQGDVEGALRFTSEELEMYPPLGGGYFGPDRSRRVLEYRRALRERWRVIEWRPGFGQGEVTAVIEMTNDVSALLGVRPRALVLFRVRGSRLAAELTLVDSRSLRRALRPFLGWAEANRPRELARVWVHGRPIRSPEAAPRIVALLGEWRGDGTPVAAPAEPEQP